MNGYGVQLPIGVLRPGAKWAAVFLLATTSLVPPPPYPELAKAEAYAREVMSKFTPARLEQALFEDPIQAAATLQMLGSALLTSDAVLEMHVGRYLNALT